jgi:hypothetical protein
MDFSTDEKHRATLDMLRETLAYLERLPPVPVTKEFCRRLRAHLEEPTQRLVSGGRRELHGIGPFTVVGLPLLEASVVDDVLTVGLPERMEPPSREECLKQLVLALTKGPVSVGLRARNKNPAD